MDVARWIILGVLFAGLFGLWFWSRRQARLAGPSRKGPGASLRVTQKRWIDRGTGVCLVEAEGETFLLAYTANGGVSWQPIAKKPVEPTAPVPISRFESILSEAGLR